MEYTRQNFKDGQVLTAEHMNKMDEKLASVPSFGAVGAGDKLEWDGNPNTPKTILHTGFVGGTGCAMFYKVSDIVITAEDLVNGMDIELWNEYTQHLGNAVKHCSLANRTIEQKEDGAFWLSVADMDGNIMNGFEIFCYPENSTCAPGIYFGANLVDIGWRHRIVSITIPGYGKFPIAKTLGPEYLPVPLQVKETDGLSDTLVWNGDVSILTNITEGGWGVLSDVVVTMEDLANGLYAECSWGMAYPVIVSLEDGLLIDNNDPDIIRLQSADENGNVITIAEFTPQGVFVGHNRSTYTIYETGQMIPCDHRLYTLTIPGFNKFRNTIAKPIDKAYLPKAAWVDDCYTDTVSKDDFNMLLRSLREAGYLAK